MSSPIRLRSWLIRASPVANKLLPLRSCNGSIRRCCHRVLGPPLPSQLPGRSGLEKGQVRKLEATDLRRLLARSSNQRLARSPLPLEGASQAGIPCSFCVALANCQGRLRLRRVPSRRSLSFQSYRREVHLLAENRHHCRKRAENGKTECKCPSAKSQLRCRRRLRTRICDISSEIRLINSASGLLQLDGSR